MRFYWILPLAVLVLAGALSGCAKPPRRHPGLIRLTYRLDASQMSKSQKANLEATRDQEMTALERRADALSEGWGAHVDPVGTDEIAVVMPDVNAEHARKFLSATAKLQFFHAVNLSTDEHPSRPYSDVPASNPDDPSVSLMDNATGKLIQFGDPAYAKIVRQWRLILEGADFEHASYVPAGNSYYPTFHFTPSGTRKIAKWCTTYFNIGEKLALVVDGKVLSVSPLKNGARISSDAEVEGSFSPQYVSSLVKLVNQGCLPVPVKEVAFEHLPA
ncbi:MAG TPA: hypothetical protein VMI31_17505 [Fimbriimonadaceae bacterium]|nr:hypothetical protein [Fimbriimonadaceae bacterium]